MINKTVYIILLNLGQHHKDLVITVYTYLHPILVHSEDQMNAPQFIAILVSLRL